MEAVVLIVGRSLNKKTVFDMLSDVHELLDSPSSTQCDINQGGYGWSLWLADLQR